MNEREAQSRFTKYIRETCFAKTCAWELKLTKGNLGLAFSSFQPQQLPSLLKAKHGCVYKKLSDADPTLKPFDAFQICNADAYVVACWYRERIGITAYWIDIDVFMEMIKVSVRKSIKEVEAAKFAFFTHQL